MSEQRRLAAILVADVVGYSRMVGQDEAGTLARLAALRSEVIEPAITRYGGRLFKAVGDGFLVEFASAVQAVACAKAIQDANSGGGLPLRIGIHVGDVVVEGDDLLGDGVNIAARIEGIADAGGIAISRAVHEQGRDKLDVSFVDKGEVSLKNLARPVQVFALSGADPSSAVEAAPALALPDKPSIAVLPFQNMSGDPEQEYFVDGLVEDIITALSRFKSLFVIARNSSFTYKGKAVDIKQVGRELGVRYVLEGSVRKAGGRVRITGQLIDAASGAHIWANRFDRNMTDIFALQDEATQSVVSAVEPNLRFAEVARKAHVPTQHLNAYDCYLRALAEFDAFTERSLIAAEGLLRRAVKIDPNYSDAWTLLAQTLFHLLIGGWHSGADAIQEAKQAAVTATRVGPENGLAYAVAGAYPMLFGESIDHAVELVSLAIALHPNSEVVRQCAGWAFLYSGDFSTALEHLEAGMRISPLGRGLGAVQHGIALVHFFQRDFHSAIEQANRALAKMPENPNVWRVKAAALAHTEQHAEVRDALRQLLMLAPSSSLSAIRTYFRHQWMRDLYLGGLRLAGLPE
ncbi:MAG: adenylate/guanylate cyclase domain-containing protein [Reyranellaceae bacterium]